MIQMKILATITEIIGWLQIAALPSALGVISALIIIHNISGPTGKVLGALAAILSIAIGIVWATKVWKKHGTVWFLSRVNASPELDAREESIEGNLNK